MKDKENVSIKYDAVIHYIIHFEMITAVLIKLITLIKDCNRPTLV